MTGTGAPLPTNVRAMVPEDWPEVARIFGEGIATHSATFEQEVPTWEAWDSGHLGHSRWVASTGAELAGWAALSPVSRRSCYAGVAEISIYVSARARGQGIGGRLLAALVQSAEAAGIWTLQAGIFAENTASVRLHESSGFRFVGRRERIARLDGIWRDTLLFERRSSAVGE